MTCGEIFSLGIIVMGIAPYNIEAEYFFPLSWASHAIFNNVLTLFLLCFFLPESASEWEMSKARRDLLQVS